MSVVATVAHLCYCCALVFIESRSRTLIQKMHVGYFNRTTATIMILQYLNIVRTTAVVAAMKTTTVMRLRLRRIVSPGMSLN